MKKLVVLSVMALTGCVAGTATIKKPDGLQDQPPQVLKTEGAFWGLGRKGTFQLGQEYSGRYDRNASSSSWLGDFISTSKSSMAAEVVNNQTEQRWQLVCSGGGTGVNLSIFSFGGGDPYSCDIYQGQSKVGRYQISENKKLLDLGPTGKVTGQFNLGTLRYRFESVHEAEGSFIPVDTALGYYFYSGGQLVAAVQTNGAISLQHKPLQDVTKKDALVLGMVASALSWRTSE